MFTFIAALFADITFFEVMVSLLLVALIEQVWIRLPKEIVGPGGWLVDTGATRGSRS